MLFIVDNFGDSMIVKICIEIDFLGEVCVVEDVFWGVQMQCSLQNFKIGSEILLLLFVCVFVFEKKVVVQVNFELGQFLKCIVNVIVKVVNEVIDG